MLVSLVPYYLSFNMQVWQVLLAVRALVLPPTEDIETWLKFASLCRQNGRISQAKSTLIKLLLVCHACIYAARCKIMFVFLL